ncbi:hypothetical protein K431DRAFT_37899 [Polychaeton citri CBS 116435]|uniref:Uncharacterized protein n=1 Tax=Polychaeton citri CBS 116435 TaxID=1314669 RepID=A0A9P4PY41_9PEZI|nr:hypothetical protein K431DRAFT_37899 [Polychaeton citri CBS 116435]
MGMGGRVFPFPPNFHLTGCPAIGGRPLLLLLLLLLWWWWWWWWWNRTSNITCISQSRGSLRSRGQHQPLPALKEDMQASAQEVERFPQRCAEDSGNIDSNNQQQLGSLVESTSA